MLSKKGICTFLFLTTVLLLAVAPHRCQRQNLQKIRADGGAPPPPPIPWPSGTGAINSPYLNADGGGPPAPPIPWPPNSEQSILKVDGGAPPPPPIPWGFNSAGVDSLSV